MIKYEGLDMEYEVIKVGGYQFLVDCKAQSYTGTYDILGLHEEYEAKCLDAVKETNVSLRNAEALMQGVACECTALTVADRLRVIEITYLG